MKIFEKVPSTKHVTSNLNKGSKKKIIQKGFWLFSFNYLNDLPWILSCEKIWQIIKQIHAQNLLLVHFAF